MDNNNHKIKEEHRITKLEVQMEDIITNHLPHLQRTLNKVMFLLIASLIALAGNLALNLF